MRKPPAALFPVGIFLLTCAAFWPELQGGFNWDDDINLVTNLRYRGFDASQIGWMFSNTLLGHYMPFTWLTFPHRQHDDVVYLETFLRCEYVEEPSKIEKVSQRFTALRELALSDGESMELIAEAASTGVAPF